MAQDLLYLPRIGVYAFKAVARVRALRFRGLGVWGFRSRGLRSRGLVVWGLRSKGLEVWGLGSRGLGFRV